MLAPNRQPTSKTASTGHKKVTGKDFSDFDLAIVKKLKDEILAIQSGIEKIECGEIQQCYEFGRCSQFIYAKSDMAREVERCIQRSRSEKEFDFRIAMLRPVARTVETVNKRTRKVWNVMPNDEADWPGEPHNLPKEFDRLKKTIEICLIRLQVFGS